ncbi:hypothetical protein J31TS6_08110 [Brevibacillus reuszeri]|nr:hypothetical protein J31TS6_08110 [Brevibacillus reuszeri]
MLILRAPFLLEFSILLIVMLTINFIVWVYSANKTGWRTPIIVALIQSIVVILLDTLFSSL